jgi:hypothetical protein
MSKKRGMSADEKSKALVDLYLEEVTAAHGFPFALRLIFQVRQTLAGHGVELEGAGKARAQEERHWCDATRTRTRRTRAHNARARSKKRKSQKIDFSVALNRALVVQCNNL